MKKILILLLSLVFWSCTPEDIANESATESTGTTGEPSPSTEPQIPTTTDDLTVGTSSSTAESTTDSTGAFTTGEMSNECTDATTAFDQGGGTGESFDPYVICTVDQLKDLSDRMAEGYHKHFILMKDLDFFLYYAKGLPQFLIGQNDKENPYDPSFIGSFNGNGKIMRNFLYHDLNRVDAALFVRAVNASFTNIKLENFTVTARANVSSLVATCGNCKFEAVEASNLNLESKEGGAVGGLVAIYVGGKYDNVIVQGLSLDFTVASGNGDGYPFLGVGGLLGSHFSYIKGSAEESPVIQNVHVQGNINEVGNFHKSFKSYHGDIGGLVGSIHPYNETEKAQVLDSTSRVDINLLSPYERVGGLIGSCMDTYIHTAGTIPTYEGQLFAPESVDVGGIAGLMFDCEANHVLSSATIHASQEVGGIAGFLLDSNFRKADLKADALHVFRQGETIVGTDKKINIRQQLLKEIGYQPLRPEQSKILSGQLVQAVSKGTLFKGKSDFQSAGGLVGYMRENAKISRSWSEMNIQGSGDQIGGLVGRASERNLIEDCHYSGNIDVLESSTEIEQMSMYVGGIIGFVAIAGSDPNNAATIRRVYSTGVVKGSWFVGGVVGGFSSSVASTLSDSFSTSTVLADDPQLAAGITWNKDPVAVSNIFFWSENADSKEKTCFENFILPNCETMNAASFQDINHSVYVNGQWDFMNGTWKANANALPTLNF